MKTKAKPQRHGGTEPKQTTEGNEAPANGLEELKWVLRKSIQPDPDQPRKEFKPEALQELADSMKAIGQKMPLLVEWVPGLEVLAPDLVETQWRVAERGTGKVLQREETEQLATMWMNAQKRGDGFYKIIFGERRWRSAELAGLDRMKVMVADTSGPNWEKQKLAIQMAENQHRQDLSALEEAAAYQKEIESGRHTAESLYEALGISRGKLFQRLALNRLDETVRQAIVEGKISVSVATLAAMVPDAKKRAEFVERVSGTEWRPPMPFRQANDLLEDEFCQQLKGAPFDLEDALLVPMEWELKALMPNPKATPWEFKGKGPLLLPYEGPCHVRAYQNPKNTLETLWGVYAGTFSTPLTELRRLMGPAKEKDCRRFAEFIDGQSEGLKLVVTRFKGGACEDCPFRTANMPELADAKNRPNVCTQPVCYHQKIKAHWVKAAEGKIAKGETVLDLTTYKRTKGEYVEADKHEYCENKSGTWKELMGKKAPEPLLATTEKGLVKVYKKEEALAAARKNGVRFYSHSRSTSTPEDRAKEAEKEKQAEAARKLREQLALEAAQDLGKALDRMSDKEAWKLLAGTKRDAWDITALEKEIRKGVKTDKGQVLAELLGSRGEGPSEYKGWDKDAVKVWKDLGVDLLALEKEAEKKAEKSGGGQNQKAEG